MLGVAGAVEIVVGAAVAGLAFVHLADTADAGRAEEAALTMAVAAPKITATLFLRYALAFFIRRHSGSPLPEDGHFVRAAALVVTADKPLVAAGPAVGARGLRPD